VEKGGWRREAEGGRKRREVEGVRRREVEGLSSMNEGVERGGGRKVDEGREAGGRWRYFAAVKKEWEEEWR